MAMCSADGVNGGRLVHLMDWLHLQLCGHGQSFAKPCPQDTYYGASVEVGKSNWRHAELSYSSEEIEVCAFLAGW